MGWGVFESSIQRLNSKNIYGFDIETCNNNKKFILAGIWGIDGTKHTYTNKDTFIEHIKKGIFNDSYIVATNLGFDFFGTFFGNDIIKNFRFIFRGSDLLFAKTYIYDGTFHAKSNGHKTSITFVDTMNYAKMSVESLGEMIKVPKLGKPDFLGKYPKDKQEMNYLKEYNLRDCEVSARAFEFFIKSFEELGATVKLTIASTSMSLYRNKYLKDTYFRHKREILIEQFKGYYGGRTEALKRGLIKDYNYYDINSLYPFVMTKHYPDPNSLRITYQDTDYYINNYEGMSKVKIFCPDMNIPLLPFRMKEGTSESAPHKLIFPTGTFEGYYCHNELRQALKLGYRLIKIYKSFYYTKNCYPFKEFVEDLYAKRLKYQAIKSPMEKVIKINMNSLYGKFGQKFENKDNIIPLNHTADELMKFKFHEITKDGKFLRIKEDRISSNFCIPIWASYVTSYGRIELHNYMRKCKPVYVDTDSLITKSDLEVSKDLGGLKLERRVKKGIIVKPKFYGIVDDTGKDYVKIKGVGTKLVFTDFGKLMLSPKVTYEKFIKFRESLRRGMIPNEIIDITKELSLADTKRVWNGVFNPHLLSSSIPIHIPDTK